MIEEARQRDEASGQAMAEGDVRTHGLGAPKQTDVDSMPWLQE